MLSNVTSKDLVLEIEGICSLFCLSPLCRHHLQVIIFEEKYDDVSGTSFIVRLARPTLVFNKEAILPLYSGKLRLFLKQLLHLS